MGTGTAQAGVRGTVIVIPDASILLKWVLPGGDERNISAALSLREEAAAGAVELVVPQLWVYEAGRALARQFPERADDLLSVLVDFRLREARLDARWRTRAVSLAVTYDVSFYTAAYHALALALGGVFVTADERYVSRASEAGGVSLLRRWREQVFLEDYAGKRVPATAATMKGV